jgi:hypothetical protein
MRQRLFLFRWSNTPRFQLDKRKTCTLINYLTGNRFHYMSTNSGICGSVYRYAPVSSTPPRPRARHLTARGARYRVADRLPLASRSRPRACTFPLTVSFRGTQRRADQSRTRTGPLEMASPEGPAFTLTFRPAPRPEARKGKTAR